MGQSQSIKPFILVLWVDDQPGVIEAFSRVLRSEGDAFDIDSATSIPEAREKLKTEKYAAFVMDGQMDSVNLAAHNGLAFLLEVNEKYKWLPTFFYAAFEDNILSEKKLIEVVLNSEARITTVRDLTESPGRNQPVRHGLYPEIEPYLTDRLEVSDIHTLYYEECGNPEGKPVVVLHGGPGSGNSKRSRRFHDPDRYRIILYDQRGAGRSESPASLEENTTWHLVEDLEKLRRHLGIDEQWQVFGGSWGSTLALAYAQSYPEAVSELVLRGIFLLRRVELEWFYQSGADTIYPDAWEDYLAPIPEEERHDLMLAYHRRLTGHDRDEQLQAARAWSLWETRTGSIVPDPEKLNRAKSDEFALAFARIENHYFVNGGFFEPEDQLLKGIDRIRHIPAVIVQGRYDLVCPMRTAWDLAKAWPEADLRIILDAGHSAYEPGITHELIAATIHFARG